MLIIVGLLVYIITLFIMFLLVWGMCYGVYVFIEIMKGKYDEFKNRESE